MNMKLIPLSEAKAHLRRYGKLCQREKVVVTVQGVPSFQISPLDEDDDGDFMSRLIETNPEFRALLEARKKERCISAEEALRRLEE